MKEGSKSACIVIPSSLSFGEERDWGMKVQGSWSLHGCFWPHRSSVELVCHFIIAPGHLLPVYVEKGWAPIVPRKWERGKSLHACIPSILPLEACCLELQPPHSPEQESLSPTPSVYSFFRIDFSILTGIKKPF